MGAWFYGPIDNDAAADWMGDTMHKSKLPKLIEKGLKSKSQDVVRAAAFLLEQVGYTYMYDIEVLDKHLALAVEKLDALRNDEDWLSSWSQPGAVRRSIGKQLDALQTRLGGEGAPGSTHLQEAIEKKKAKKKTKKKR